jgi:hypothetical protein
MPVTVQVVNAEDTLEVGRQKFNANDDALQDQGNSLEAAQAAHVTAGHPTLYYSKTEIDSQQSTQDAALTTHKSGGDHDARYLAASYLATLVRTTLDQVIGGIKTFANKIIVKTNSPSIELQHDDGYPFARFYANGDTGTLAEAGIAISNMGNFSSAIAIDGNGNVNSPNGDMKAKGKILATQDYVTDAVSIANKASGAFFYIDRSLSFDDLIGAPPGSVNLIEPVFVSQQAYLTEIGLSRVGSGFDNKIHMVRAAALSIPISSAWHNVLKVVLSVDDHGGSTLELFGALGMINQLTTSDVVWDNLKSITLSQGDIVYRGATQISVYLKFELPAVGEAIAPPIQQ